MDSSVAVSVLMPTFKQECFIQRALESLLAQQFSDWELIIVDDGSPDCTRELASPYLADQRIVYHRFDRNRGLGAALNFATGTARGRYLAYLPSDDVFYPNHLRLLVGTLDAQPELYLAYGGVRSNRTWAGWAGPTLLGESAVGRELDGLEGKLAVKSDFGLANDNVLALVQAVHRRDLEEEVRWATRDQVVSDHLEPDFWRGLLRQGAKASFVGALTCEWTDHPDQRHKIIADPERAAEVPGAKAGRGLSGYKSYYGVRSGEFINWVPSNGGSIDERARYGRFAVKRKLPAVGGLKILVVGELGFNPERLAAFEELGHKLYSLWHPFPMDWDTAGPLAFGNVEDIPFDVHWPDRVRDIKPDIAYALLNSFALPITQEVLQADLDLPLVFHFKESPQNALQHGHWGTLQRVLEQSDGQIFISEENLAWLRAYMPRAVEEGMHMVLDGDMPKKDWMTEDWAPKLSRQDGQVHTVCVGRPVGIGDLRTLASAGVHLHLYGEWSRKKFSDPLSEWLERNRRTGVLHLHPAVEPADWVSELSQYDAAWVHTLDSSNGGDIRSATWSDLNLPARMGTYAAAGLPWILKDNRHSTTAVQSVAERFDIGLFFRNYTDLAQRLYDRKRLAQLTSNMREARQQFAFDSHTGRLVEFFRRAIARHR